MGGSGWLYRDMGVGGGLCAPKGGEGALGGCWAHGVVGGVGELWGPVLVGGYQCRPHPPAMGRAAAAGGS